MSSQVNSGIDIFVKGEETVKHMYLMSLSVKKMVISKYAPSDRNQVFYTI